MTITVFTDNPRSWFVPYGEKLKQKLAEAGHDTAYVFDAKDIRKGDVCFLLSCTRLVKEPVLSLNRNNIVVHASDLPLGKGFSPLQWQVLEGKNDITLTLFEVAKDADAGPYYLKDQIHFRGTELLEEMRKKMALKIIDMCEAYIVNQKQLPAIEQTGVESFYRRRTDADDRLDENRSIAEQFNHFRIADNESFPLYFNYKGEKYFLKIYKGSDANSD